MYVLHRVSVLGDLALPQRFLFLVPPLLRLALQAHLLHLQGKEGNMSMAAITSGNMKFQAHLLHLADTRAGD